MNVVLRVAAVARGEQVYLFLDRLVMTSMALDSRVSTVEHEVRLGIVIEAPYPPVVRIMT